MIRRIKKDYLLDTLRIFRWIIYSFRPLTTAELRYAIGFDEHCTWSSQEAWKKSKKNYIHKKDMEKFLRSRTAGLIEIGDPTRPRSTDLDNKEAPPDLSKPVIPSLESSSPQLGSKSEQMGHHQNAFNRLYTEPISVSPGDSNLRNLDTDTSSSDSSDDSWTDDCEQPDRLSQQRKVQFFHQSAKEYFRTNGLQIFGIPGHKSTRGDCHVALSRTCIIYSKIAELHDPKLQFQDSVSEHSKSPLKKLFRRHPFLRYALHFWDQHADQVETESGKSQRGIKTEFTENGENSSSKHMRKPTLAD
ncbi:hypothetical protein MMC11_000436 [Xylographa trunciseda]|nr:hypothetical protein [Xylographa trunciseda]